jgi:hypothetical protein
VPFWLVLLLFSASVVLGQLFRPKIAPPKPASLSDLDFPTAEETRSIAKAYGTVLLKAPNVVSVTDFSSEPIKQSFRNPATLFLTKKSTTVGFRYFCGIEMSLCYRFDSLLQINIGDKVAWTGNVTTDSEILINNKTLFGGDDPTSGGNGGVYGYLGVHVGLPNASKDAYLVSEYGNYSAHRGVGYVVWKGQHRAKGSGYLGNNTRVDPWAFVVRSLPANIPGATAYANINSGDANPAEVIYDIMRNSEYAAGMNGALIDDASFAAAAQIYYTDGIGFSALWDTSKPCRDVINGILQLTDSLLYSDMATGKMVLKPARANYDISTLPVYDESNILALSAYSRGAWDETTNEVKVPYVDRFNDFITRTAPAQDLANQRIQGGTVSSNVQHVGISNSATAANIAMRDLKALTTPLAKITIQMNRQAYKMVPGGVFKFTWLKIKDERGNPIQNMVMRCIGVKYGDTNQPIIEIDAVEDVFNATSNVFAAPPAPAGSSVSSAPAPATIQRITELPYFFTGDDGAVLWGMAAAPNSGNFTFDLYDSTDNTTFEPDDVNNSFTPTGTLLNSYANNTSAVDASNTFIVDGTSGVDLTRLSAATAADVARGINLMVVIEGTKAEIMAFESYTINGSGHYVFNNVWRGLLDTTPKAFTNAARVYFFSYGDARGTLLFNIGATAYAKLLTRSLQGVLSEGSATTLSQVITRRALRPYAPGNVRINTSFTTVTIPATGDVVVAWLHRDRTRQSTVISQSDTTVPGLEGGATYTLKIYNQAGTLLRTLTNMVTVTYTYTNVQEMADNGDVLANALTFVLYTVRDGLDSHQAQVRGVSRDATAPYVPTYTPAGTYAAPATGSATSISGVPITGTPTDTNNTPVYNPITGQITWQPGGGAVTVREIDGMPTGTASTIEFQNGTVTDMGGGVFRVTGLQGAPGNNGTPGSVWYYGSGVPSSGLGINGDYYLRTSNDDVYQKASGSWSVIANLKGSPGTPGIDGNGFTRQNYSYTTASLPSGGFETVDATLYRSILFKILITNYPARVRAYATNADRTADAGRAAWQVPVTPIIFDVYTDASHLTWPFIYEAIGGNKDSTITSKIYLSIQNLDTVSRAINIQLNYLPLEN